LVAGGADDAKMDNLKSNEGSSNQVITQSVDGTTSFSQNFDLPKDAVPATPKGNAKTVERTEGTGSQEGKMVPTKEGTDSQPGFEMGSPEKPEYAKTVERTEGTDSQEGKMVPAKEGN
ncbi:alpha-ketoglutarate permease, partial [Bacillus thuringiensis]